MLEYLHPDDINWWKTTFQKETRVPEPGIEIEEDGGPVERPDVTKNQVIALVFACATAFSVFVSPLNDEQVFALVGLATAVCGLLMHSDAKIRVARNQAFTAEVSAATDIELAKMASTDDV